MISTH